MLKTLLLPLLAVAIMAVDAPAVTPNDAPPPGIVPSKEKLAQVLTLNHGAEGPSPHTRYEKWTYTSEGLSGTQVVYVSGNDSREDDSLGPFQSSFGQLAGTKWRQNENGLTIRLKGIHREDDADARALRNAAKPDSGVTLLGETAAPQAAYVVQVDPPGGRKEWLFLDKTTHLVVRRDQVWEDQRVIETFDDFRKTAAHTDAWHVHMSDGRKYNDEDYKLDALELDRPIDAARFVIPADRRSMYTVPATTAALPAKIIDDRVIVTVTINGHNEFFQLDSGASGIIIDDKAAAKLGLKTFGRSTGATAGTYVQSRTIIPQAAIGALNLRDVAVESVPFLNMADEKTFVIGLLGYDFIAGSVIHIDYLNQKVEAIDSAAFVPPAGATSIPVALDDGVPYATGSVAGVRPTSFIIDTGADRSTLFSTFALRHKSAMVDQGLGDAIEAAYPFVDHVRGVGGTINVRSTQVKNFQFAGLTFNDWLFMVTQERKSFEGEDFDGLIGQDFLRNFDVYLDYSHARVIIVPNDRFKARWPRA